MRRLALILFFLSNGLLLSKSGAQTANHSEIEILILGNAQDGGYPQISCQKECCIHTVDKGYVTSLAVIQHSSKRVWLIDCTPDFREQWQMISDHFNGQVFKLEGIFLTHAHIGHYTGLSQLGREVMGTKNVPVYVMPRMKQFLEQNGPWDQLVKLENIKLISLINEVKIEISERLNITPILVPHRDEYSETVGFQISGPNKKLLFIPDIDKWESWNNNIEEQVLSHDYNLLDATFYSINELPGRNMDEIPHPLVVESLDRFKELSLNNKSRIYFIHFNHSNPLLRETIEQKTVLSKGYSIATQNMVLKL